MRAIYQNKWINKYNLRLRISINEIYRKYALWKYSRYKYIFYTLDCKRSCNFVFMYSYFVCMEETILSTYFLLYIY